VNDNLINPHSPKNNKLKWIDEDFMKDEPEEVRNDKKCFSKFIITNDSQKDLIYNDSPDKVDTH
jgi:hypothetical protein